MKEPKGLIQFLRELPPDVKDEILKEAAETSRKMNQISRLNKSGLLTEEQAKRQILLQSGTFVDNDLTKELKKRLKPFNFKTDK